MDYAILTTELTTDPLSRGYSGMTAEEAAADLNTVYRTRPRDQLSGDEIFQATDATEFAALDDGSQSNVARDLKTMWVSFCGRDQVDPFGSANVAFVQWIFGSGSATIANLNTIRNEPVSRAVELGLGPVKTGDVEIARAG